MKKILKAFFKKMIFGGVFPLVYRWNARKPIKEKSVLFIEIRYDKLTNNFTLLWDELEKKEDWFAEAVFLGMSECTYVQYLRNCLNLIRKIATVNYVFVNEGNNMLAALPIRKETHMIQTWHGCGAFKRFGHCIAGGLQEKFYNQYSLTTVTSEKVVDIYAESMKQAKETVLPLGVSRTDVFFSKEFIENCNLEIRKRYDISSEKKIILYAPTFRGNAQCAIMPRMLRIDLLYSAWKEDYVILYKGHPAVKEKLIIKDTYRDFCIDASDATIESLLCAANLCITDYSSLIFEYAILERPILFFAYDYKEYVTERGFYYDYEDFVPGPICYTEEDLLQWIGSTESQNETDAVVRCEEKREYMLQQVRSFREKYMSACDGRSTERIIQYLSDNNI